MKIYFKLLLIILMMFSTHSVASLMSGEFKGDDKISSKYKAIILIQYEDPILFLPRLNELTSYYKSHNIPFVVLNGSKSEINETRISEAVNDFKNAEELQIHIISHGLSVDRDHFEMGGFPGSKLKETLTSVTKLNPNLKITIPITSCFSGALARELSDVNNVLVLPSAGDDRVNVVTTGGSEKARNEGQDVYEKLYSRMFQGLSYHDAEEAAWQAQFKFLTSSSSLSFEGGKSAEASVEVTYAHKDKLHLRRSMDEEYLNKWCDSDQKQIGANFCLFCEGISRNEVEKRKLALLEFKSINQDHIDKLMQFKRQMNCDQPGKLRDAESKLIKSRKSIFTNFFSDLQKKIASLNVDELRKNRVAHYKREIELSKSGHLNEIQKYYENTDVNKKYYANIEKLILHPETISESDLLSDKIYFESEVAAIPQCFNSNFEFLKDKEAEFFVNFGKTEKDKIKSNLTCKEIFSRPYVDFYTIQGKEISNGLIKNLFDMGDSDFSSYLSKVSSFFNQNPEVDLDTLWNLAELNSQPKNICVRISNSIKEVQENIDCAEKFAEKTRNEEWKRFTEILNLDHRKMEL